MKAARSFRDGIGLDAEYIPGSTPEYAKMCEVNPTTMLLAAKLMLNWLGEDDEVEAFEDSTTSVVKEGRVKTYDMGGTSMTLEVAEEVARRAG